MRTSSIVWVRSMRSIIPYWGKMSTTEKLTSDGLKKDLKSVRTSAELYLLGPLTETCHPSISKVLHG